MCKPIIPSKKLVLKKGRQSGFFFGEADRPDRYIGLPQNEESHILIIGGSGTGKSSAIAIPTLGTWDGIIVALDVKGELSLHYARLYQDGFVQRKFLVFDPTDEETICYDVFEWLKQGDSKRLYDSLRDIVNTIIPESPNVKDPFWELSERSFLKKILGYLFRLGLGFADALAVILNTSLAEFCDKLSQPEFRFTPMYVAGNKRPDPGVLADIELGLYQKLEDFVYSCLGHAFRADCQGEPVQRFDWSCLDEYNVFIRIPDSEVEAMGPALNIMFAQLIQFLQRRKSKYDDSESLPVLLLMDEFPRLGKLARIKPAITMLRSRNVTLCLMIQSFPQLEEIYGEKVSKIITDNCRTKIILGANDPATQREISAWIGDVKKRKANVSINLDTEMDPTGYGLQLSTEREAIIPPHKLATLKDVIVLTRFGYAKVKKRKMVKIEGRRFHKPVCSDFPLFPAELDHPHGFLRNEGATMLPPEERLKLAEKCFLEAERHYLEEQLQRMPDLKLSDERNAILGRLLLKVMPNILKLVPCEMDGDEYSRFWPIEARMIALENAPELFASLRSQASLLSPMEEAEPVKRKGRRSTDIFKQVTGAYVQYLGQLMSIHFEDVCNIDPCGSEAELAERFWPVEAFLRALANDPAALEQLEKDAENTVSHRQHISVDAQNPHRV